MTTERPVTEDDMHAYVDGALDGGRSSAIEAYLAQRADVAARVDGYRRQRAGLRAALRPVADEPVPADLGLATLIERHRRPTRPLWQAAAAAVALFGLGGVSGFILRPAPVPANGIAALAEEAASSYAVYEPDRVHPVEFEAAQSDELLRWIASRVGRFAGVPDLAASGYRFMGGRVVATPHGPAGFLMYDDDHGTRIALMVRRMEVDKQTRMTEHGNGPVAGYTWSDRGWGYGLVGATSPSALHPLADEMRRQIDERA